VSNAALRRSPDAVVLAGAAALLLAVVVPTSWLTGGAGADDPRHLEFGALLWRLGGCLLGVFLILTGRASRDVRVPTEPTERRVLVAGAALVAGALVLRLWALSDALWFDEIWLVVDTIRQPLGDLVRGFESDNNHPLYSLCAWFSVAAFGETAFALRLPAALFGAAGVAALLVFVRARFPAALVFLPVWLLVVSRHHIWFSQNARAYTALLCFTLLSSHLFLRALETGSRRAWLGHGLTLGLCVYAHVTGTFVAVGHVAVLAYRWRHAAPGGKEGLRAGVFGLVLGVLVGFWLYALVLPQMLYFFLLRPGRVAIDAEWTNPLWMIETALASFGLSGTIAWVALLVGLVGGAYALWALWQRSPETAILLAVPVVTVAVAMLGLGRNLWPRLFFFQAGFAVIAGVAVLRDVTRRCSLWRGGHIELGDQRWKRVQWALGSGAFVWLVVAPGVYGAKQDFPGALEWVQANVPVGEPVVTVGLARYPYERYFEAPFQPVETLAQYEAALGAQGRGTVIYTFPIYMQSRETELWERVRADGREAARFPGTVGDGDVVVLRVREGAE